MNNFSGSTIVMQALSSSNLDPLTFTYNALVLLSLNEAFKHYDVVDHDSEKKLLSLLSPETSGLYCYYIIYYDCGLMTDMFTYYLAGSDFGIEVDSMVPHSLRSLSTTKSIKFNDFSGKYNTTIVMKEPGASNLFTMKFNALVLLHLNKFSNSCNVIILGNGRRLLSLPRLPSNVFPYRFYWTEDGKPEKEVDGKPHSLGDVVLSILFRLSLKEIICYVALVLLLTLGRMY
ncbi:hypothetical protein DXG01_006209 [Tephrocybe rancida]|nr:hypothetical protein DXG01_006209 [Tephrocybe rancida]